MEISNEARRFMDRNSFERARWIQICIVAIFLMIIYKTLDNFSQITTAVSRFFWVISPLFYGILFAYFLYTPHQKIEKIYGGSKTKFLSTRARGLSTLTIFFLLMLVIVLISSFILPVVVASANELVNSIPSYRDLILHSLDNVPEDSIWYSINIADTVRDSFTGLMNEYTSPDRIEKVARGIISFTGEVMRILLGLVMSLYILMEREKLIASIKRLVAALFKNERVRAGMSKYLNQVNQVLFTFIASKGLDSIINLVTVTSILLILNVPYAFLLGLIAGLFNFIPYLGSLIAVILISVMTLITGGVGKAIQVVIPLLIFQQLDGNFIEPRIMKSSLKISPILVIIAVVVGGAYFGIIGMFLAVPIVAIIKQVLNEYVSSHESE